MNSDSTPTNAPPLAMDVRVRLSIMMFLQFAIWGSWATVFGNYLKHLQFNEGQIGWLTGLMPLGGIIGPMLLILSQLPDRFVSSQKILGVIHLASAGLFFWASTIQSNEHYDMLMIAMFSYALFYNMTLALTNSIAFANCVGERDFPSLRVFGTIGWIAMGFTLDYVLSSPDKEVFKSNTFLQLSAVLSGVLGLLSFFLPNTPPSGKKGDALPFIKALNLFKDKSFAVFFAVSFIITIVLAFYYSFTGLYLEQSHGVKKVASTMIWGQVAEIFFMLLLPAFLSIMGMKGVLAFGMLCWGIRYALFAISAGNESLYPLAFVGILLHGICFDFFFAAAFIYVDKKAPPDIRASAQALFSFLTYGLGMFIGSIAAGQLAGMIGQKNEQGTFVTDWGTYWWIPSIGVLISLAIFLVFFREQDDTKNASNA